MIILTQITNTKICAFIAVPVFIKSQSSVYKQKR